MACQLLSAQKNFHLRGCHILQESTSHGSMFLSLSLVVDCLRFDYESYFGESEWDEIYDPVLTLPFNLSVLMDICYAGD